jgi:hypothetical protein
MQDFKAEWISEITIHKIAGMQDIRYAKIVIPYLICDNLF